MSDTKERLRQLLNAEPDFKMTEAVGDDDALMKTGVVDSFDMITLVVRIEKAFGLAFSPDDVTEENFESITSIAAFVDAQLNSSDAPGR